VRSDATGRRQSGSCSYGCRGTSRPAAEASESSPGIRCGSRRRTPGGGPAAPAEHHAADPSSRARSPTEVAGDETRWARSNLTSSPPRSCDGDRAHGQRNRHSRRRRAPGRKRQWVERDGRPDREDFPNGPQAKPCAFAFEVSLYGGRFCFRWRPIADFLKLELRGAPPAEHAAAEWLDENANPVEPVRQAAGNSSVAANRGRTGRGASAAPGACQSRRDPSPALPADSPLTTRNRR
jgi:hypothetical protein